MPKVHYTASNEDPVSRAVAGFLAASSLERVMVAVSGGPDSVALLLCVAEESVARGMGVFACWVDHGIRPEDEILLERLFVEGLCKDLGVELSVQTAGRGALVSAARKEGGIEAAARRFRYEALERARRGFACDAILTGHTADDFMETMVMRFCTGSGTAGLRGIPARNGAIARPLLPVGKEDVLRFLRKRGQAYRIDSTNLGVDYLRNRVRKDVLPGLLSVFPSLGTSLATLAGKLAMDEDALAEAASALLVDADEGSAGDPSGGLQPVRSIDAGLFDKAPMAVRIRALYLIAAPLGAGRLSGSLVLAAAGSAKPSGTLSSGAGIEFARENGMVVARARAGRASGYTGPGARGYSLIARVPGSYRIGTDMAITIYSTGKTGGPRNIPLAWPVCIRSRRPGDSIPLRCGHKMVDTLLSEYRIHPSVRDITPVVEDRVGVAAVLCSCAGGRDIYRDVDIAGDGRAASGGSMDYFSFYVKGAVLTDAT